MPAVMLGVFAFTLFCSASLLFLVEPMVGKMMLPLLGGTPAVWNTCMVFFQAVLLAGYAYAHASTTWLGPRKQAAAHFAVLVLPFAFFLFNGPLAVNADLIAGRESNPIPALLLVLSLSVGVPMFVVCTSAPLLQRWFASTDHPVAQDPYFLYGASNLGSMLALVGYPALVEPFLPLRDQRYDWAFGYGFLAVLTAACAFLMWKSRLAPAEIAVKAAEGAGLPTAGPSEAITTSESAIKEPLPAPAAIREERERLPVTWRRRLKWTVLALAPSSLMLGATTYITTDIAAIPLLWVLPLALYLLTFIIVFAQIGPITQKVAAVVGIEALLLATWIWLPDTIPNERFLWFAQWAAVVLAVCTLLIFLIKDPAPLHRVVVLLVPLLVLLLLFVMVSNFELGITAKVALNLVTLFVVSLACHCELARDRPEPKYLTEYFLLMSVGGVIGGLFNALVAPVVFNAIIEYQLMLMAACLLLPPEPAPENARLARQTDLMLAATMFVVGGVLLGARWRDQAASGGEARLDLRGLWTDWLPWIVGVGVVGLLGFTVRRLRDSSSLTVSPEQQREERTDRVLDIVLPVSLTLLLLGLCWGLSSAAVSPALKLIADKIDFTERLLRLVVAFGLPAVLCYVFVDRPLRFGLGVGAILLGAALYQAVSDPALCQRRSFFGVLRVKPDVYSWGGARYEYNRLIHGTTIHGEQFTDPALRDIPLTYFHRTGPIGRVFRTCNNDPTRPVAVIGLGAGTLASYAQPGQTFDFFDIDPEVVDLSFDTNQYFTFVEDAADRSVHISLVLGDARLTFEPKGTRLRLLPLRKRPGSPVPPRKFGEPLTKEEKYGLIVVDAFSSDAIPVHLITRAALKMYESRLLPGGILCMHISNRHLDLEPVLANIVEDLGLVGYHLPDKLPDDNTGPVAKLSSHWVVIARQKDDLAKLLAQPGWQDDEEELAVLGAILWPAPAGTALAASSGLSYALERIASDARKKERKAGRPANRFAWQPLGTLPELQRQLAAETDERRIDKLTEDIALSRRVGVWTDDYSNLLSVFRWKASAEEE